MLPQATPFRASPLTVAAAAGATAGLAAYQAITFGHGESLIIGADVMRTVLVVFAVMTWQVVRTRDTEAPRRPWFATAGAAVGGLAATLGVAMLMAPPLALSRLSETRMPGFVLAVPSTLTTNGDYAQGNARTKGDQLGLIVSWQTGELLTDDDARLVIGGISALLPGRASVSLGAVSATRIAGAPGRTAAVSGAMDGRMSWFGCDGRWVMVMTVASSSGAGHLHQRILASARCTPEAHEAPTTALGATRTEGWFATEPPQPGALAMVREDGTVLVATTQRINERTTAAIPTSMVETLLASAEMPAALGPAESATGPDGPRSIWSGTAESYEVVAAMWHCEAPLRLVLAFGAVPTGDTAAASRDELRQQLATVHCLKAGEAAPVLPMMDLSEDEDADDDEAAEPAAK